MYFKNKTMIHGTMILFIGCVILVWIILFRKLFNSSYIVSLKHKRIDAESLTTMHIPNVLTLVNDPTKQNDTDKLIDLTNFKYLINQPACLNSKRHNTANDDESSLITVILIHSEPKNSMNRNLIRETWGQSDPKSRILFVLGATNSTLLQHKIIEETDQFHDIIQGNFIDSNQNLAYKHVMSLKWFTNKCPNVKFLFKADDDIFVNLPTVYDFMKLYITELNMNNFIICHVMKDGSDVRQRKSKWRVSRKNHFYPAYCSGYAMIYSNDAVRRIYQKAQKTPYFWDDDIHVTGTLRNQSNVSILPYESHYYLNEEKIDELIDGRIHIQDVKQMFVFVRPHVQEAKIRKLWNILKHADDWQ